MTPIDEAIRALIAELQAPLVKRIEALEAEQRELAATLAAAGDPATVSEYTKVEPVIPKAPVLCGVALSEARAVT